MNETYKPTLESVKKHKVPEWYHDAKFGIFIHWSISSIPAFAPKDKRDIKTKLKEISWKEYYATNPYAEWYLNSLRIKESPVYKYHVKKYGENYSYDNFADAFNKNLEKWDPQAYADLFKKVGARYVVLVTKHHDGFLLWHSDHPNPIKKNWMARRDIVGELTQAVKSKGMRMGFYYSGALDWTFTSKPIIDTSSFAVNGPADKKYAAYCDAHFRELVDKFKPSILWNDIAYPPESNPYDLFAYFYNKIPDGVVNDRWVQIPKKWRPWLMLRPFRTLLNWLFKKATIKKGIVPPAPPHSDYATPEYTTLSKISERKWECVRGIGESFGYNQMETPEDYLTSKDLVRMLVDIVSKNGNLLLNIGPMADGTIPDVQVKRVEELGEWLNVNGEAIFKTRPFDRAEGVTEDNIDIRFTRKDKNIYAILLAAPKKPETIIKSLSVPSTSTITLLGYEKNLKWEKKGDDIHVQLPGNMPESQAYTLRIR